MIGKGILVDFKIKDTLREYKENIISNCGSIHPKQLEFAEGLIKEFYGYSGEQIYVNSNRCGMGKSTLLKAFLNHLVNNYMYFGDAPSRKEILNGYGAIIIHDSIKGLEDIATYEGLQDRCYFMRYDKVEDDNRNKLSSSTEFTEQLEEQRKYPIVLITTQKYFKMNPQERARLYSWGNGNKRVIKIIDEKPYVISTTTIDETYLSDIGIALERLPNDETKNYILTCWDKIKRDLKFIRNSYSDKYSVMWIKKEDRSLISKQEDKKFFELLSNLPLSANTYDKISAIKQIYSDGCLFESNKYRDQDNMRKFTLLHNNLEKFDLNKCSCFVLDATSKFDADYRLDDAFYVYGFPDKKDVRDINVHHIAVSTSQKTLIENDFSMVEGICKWGNETLGETSFVATYSKKRGIYQKLQDGLNSKSVLYFGDIKGKNDWESYETMAHIGLNRKSNTVYLQKYIVLTSISDKWNEMEDEDIQKEIDALLEISNEKDNKGLFANATMNDIMIGDIVADTVQNIMRIKCRHFTNSEICNVFILCSDIYYQVISKVNATIGGLYVRQIPEVFLALKTNNRKPNEGKGKTNPQIVKEYIESLESGMIVKMKNVMERTGLTRDQIKESKKSNQWCRSWFALHKDGNKQQYIA